MAGGTGEKLRWRRAAEAISDEREVWDIAEATKCAQYWQEVGVLEAIDVWCDRWNGCPVLEATLLDTRRS